MRVVAHNGARIIGGAERATVILLSGLQSRGHDVLLMCNDDAVAQYAAAAGIPAKVAVIGGDVSLIYARRFAASLAAESPDAFIVGTWKKLFFASWAARRAAAKRVVARVGLESDTPRSSKYRYALRHWTDAVVVNADRMASSFARVEGFGADKVRVIYNGVIAPGRRSPPGQLRRELGITSETRVVGTLARLVTQKRIDRLLRAFALMPSGTHCIIAGDGPERGSLTRLAKSLGVADRVHFIGHRENKGDVLDALDLFAITSDKEGLSNSMLEAMAFGLPVVSTPVSGASEALFPDALNAAPGLITTFDEGSIAEGMTRLLRDPALREKCAAVAKARAATTFSLDTMLDKWEEVLTSRRID